MLINYTTEDLNQNFKWNVTDISKIIHETAKVAMTYE